MNSNGLELYVKLELFKNKQKDAALIMQLIVPSRWWAKRGPHQKGHRLDQVGPAAPGRTPARRERIWRDEAPQETAEKTSRPYFLSSCMPL